MLPITLLSKAGKLKITPNSIITEESLCNPEPREEKGELFHSPVKPCHDSADSIWLSFSTSQVAQLSSLCDAVCYDCFPPKGTEKEHLVRKNNKSCSSSFLVVFINMSAVPCTFRYLCSWFVLINIFFQVYTLHLSSFS